VTRREHDQAREQAVYQAQDLTPVLRAVEARPDGQAEIFELADAMYPPPIDARGYLDFRTRITRDWFCHHQAVMRVWVDLYEAGLIEIIISG
jgi:hypothetical protein